MKAMRTLVMLGLAALLALGGVGVAFAQEPPVDNALPDATLQRIAGVVTGLSETSMTLETEEGAVSVVITADTRYCIPHEGVVLYEDFKALYDRATEAGRELGVMAMVVDTDAGLEASLVRPLLPRLPFLHIAGEVTLVDGNTITITTGNGETVTLEMPREVPEELVGQPVHIAVGKPNRHALRPFGRQGAEGLALPEQEGPGFSMPPGHTFTPPGWSRGLKQGRIHQPDGFPFQLREGVALPDIGS